jgi:acyl-CoA thioesterase
MNDSRDRIINNDSEFDRALTLTGTDIEGSEGAHLDAGWQIGNAINGGLLLALAGSALRRRLSQDSGHADPFAISAYYLSASVPGPATIRTQMVRRGRSISNGEVSILQTDAQGREVERLRALATYGDLDDVAGDVQTSATPPEMPGPDRCFSAAQAPPGFLKHASFLQRLDLRLDPSTSGWAVGKPSGRGELRGWLRLPDGREPDPIMLLLAVDALPPVAFELGVAGWTPTLELTVHVRAKPAPGWLRIALSTVNYAGGFMEEDAEVWDSTGRLVAQSRQLARVVQPKVAD